MIYKKIICVLLLTLFIQESAYALSCYFLPSEKTYNVTQWQVYGEVKKHLESQLDCQFVVNENLQKNLHLFRNDLSAVLSDDRVYNRIEEITHIDLFFDLFIDSDGKQLNVRLTTYDFQQKMKPLLNKTVSIPLPFKMGKGLASRVKSLSSSDLFVNEIDSDGKVILVQDDLLVVQLNNKEIKKGQVFYIYRAHYSNSSIPIGPGDDDFIPISQVSITKVVDGVAHCKFHSLNMKRLFKRGDYAFLKPLSKKIGENISLEDKYYNSFFSIAFGSQSLSSIYETRDFEASGIDIQLKAGGSYCEIYPKLCLQTQLEISNSFLSQSEGDLYSSESMFSASLFLGVKYLIINDLKKSNFKVFFTLDGGYHLFKPGEYLAGGVENFSTYGIWPGVNGEFRLDKKKTFYLTFQNIFLAQFTSGQNLYGEDSSFDHLKFKLGVRIKQKNNKEVSLQAEHNCLAIKSGLNSIDYSNYSLALLLKKRF